MRPTGPEGLPGLWGEVAGEFAPCTTTIVKARLERSQVKRWRCRMDDPVAALKVPGLHRISLPMPPAPSGRSLLRSAASQRTHARVVPAGTLNAALSPALLLGASPEDGSCRFARSYARFAQPSEQGCAGPRPIPRENPAASRGECFSIQGTQRENGRRPDIKNSEALVWSEADSPAKPKPATGIMGRLARLDPSLPGNARRVFRTTVFFQ